VVGTTGNAVALSNVVMGATVILVLVN